MLMWVVHVALFAAFRTVGWPPEIWGGAVIFSGLAGAALSLLAVPYRSGSN